MKLSEARERLTGTTSTGGSGGIKLSDARKMLVSAPSQSTIQFTPEQQTYIAQKFKASWDYDDLDTDDLQRKAQGLAPKAVESAYTDTAEDQYLKSVGLPAYKNLEKYVEQYNAKTDTTNLENSFKNELYSGVGFDANDVDFSNTAVSLLKQEKYAPLLKRIKAERNDEDYETELDALKAASKDDDSIYLTDLFSEYQQAIPPQKSNIQRRIDRQTGTAVKQDANVETQLNARGLTLQDGFMIPKVEQKQPTADATISERADTAIPQERQDALHGIFQASELGKAETPIGLLMFNGGANLGASGLKNQVFEQFEPEFRSKAKAQGFSDFEIDNELRRVGFGLDQETETKNYISHLWESVNPEITDQEKSIMYNALNDGEKSLYRMDMQFDDSVNNVLDEQVLKTVFSVPVRAALSIAQGIVGAADMLSGASPMGAFAGDIIAQGAAQVEQAISGEIGKWQSFGSDTHHRVVSVMGDIGTEVLRMYATWGAGSIAGASAGTSAIMQKFMSASPFITTAAGNYFVEALQSGASRAEATAYGIIAGGIEGGLESFGADAMFSKAWGTKVVGGMINSSRKLLSAAGKALNTPAGKATVGALISALSNGMEEGASYALTGVAQRAIYNPEWAFDKNEFWNNVGMGALVGVVGHALAHDPHLVDELERGNMSALDDAFFRQQVQEMPETKVEARIADAQMLTMEDYAAAQSEAFKATQMIQDAGNAYNERISAIDAEVSKKQKAYDALKNKLAATTDPKSIAALSDQLASARRELAQAKSAAKSKRTQAGNERAHVVANNTAMREAAQRRLDDHAIAYDADYQVRLSRYELESASAELDEISEQMGRLHEAMANATDATALQMMEEQYDTLTERTQELHAIMESASNTHEWMQLENNKAREKWESEAEERTGLFERAEQARRDIIDMGERVQKTASTLQGWQDVQDVAQKLGVKVEAVESMVGTKQGEYRDGTIYISNQATDPAMVVFKHELTHYIESSGYYDAFQKHVWETMRADGRNMNQAIAAVQHEYRANGIELDRRDAMREIAAMYVQDNLFTNEKAIDALVKMQTRTAKGVYNWIVSTIQKLGQNKQARRLIEAERLFRKAFADVGETVSGTGASNLPGLVKGDAQEHTPAPTGKSQSSLGLSLDELIEKYGALPQGEIPSRDIQIPQRINDQTRVSLFARTATESSAMTDQLVERAKADILDGMGSYAPVTDAAALQVADTRISGKGLSGALDDWKAIADGRRRITKADIAFGERLMTEFSALGDADTTMEILADLCAEATRAGQTVQAFSMLKRMTPQGALYFSQKLADNLNIQYEHQIAKGKMQPITISPELQDAMLNAKTLDDIRLVETDIAVHIGEQIPATLADKINAWRYLAMLGNPRTHVRNIVGNVVMGGARQVKDAVGAGLESVFIKDQSQRTKAIYNPVSTEGVALLDYAESTWGDASSMMEGGKQGFEDIIQQNRKIFKTKALEWARAKNTDMLEMEDIKLFAKPAYKDAYAKAMKAKGLNAETITNAQRSEIMNHAVNEALKATFRDASAVATLLNQIEKHNTVTRLFVGGVVPFKKTPINVLKRGVEYSPIGLIKGLTVDLAKVGNGTMTAAQAIDSISSGLTGTALFALGAFLAKAGILRGGGEDDDRFEYFLRDTGVQPFSMNIGDKSITLDWMAPVAIPLFAGVALTEALDGKEPDIPSTLEALGKISDPLIQMSMLQGVNDMLASVKEGNVGGAIGSAIGSSIQNYASQFVPTVLGQVNRIAIDDTRRSTTGDPNAPFGASVARAMNKVINKTPLSVTLEPYIDKWGEQQAGHWAVRLLENTILPGYVSERDVSPINAEITRVYLQTGERNAVPAKPGRTLTENKVRYTMTNAEYTQFQEDYGKACYDAVDKLIATTGYRSASDEKKAEKLRDALNKAADKVRAEYKKKLMGGGK